MISKYIFKAVLLLALTFGSLHATAHTGPHITVGTGSDVAGSATPMVISLDYHGGNSAVGFQVDVTYDSANLTVDIASCGGILLGTGLVACSNPSAGVVRILVLAAVDLPDGTLGSLAFNVSTASVGTYDLLIPSAAELYTNIGATPVPSTGSTAGQIEITGGGGGGSPQTIDTFASTPPTLTFMGGTSILAATASSGLTVSDFGFISGPCSVAGNVVSTSGAGVCVVSADQAGNGTFDPAPQVRLNITINPADQAITGFAAAPATGGVGDTSSLSATGGASGEPVTFGSSTMTVCTVAGNTVTYVTAGTCTVTADQAGNASFNPAPQANLNITVGGLTDQVITGFAAAPTGGNVGDTSTLSATGGASGEPVTFGSNTAAVCTVTGNTVTYVTIGLCTVTADQAGDASFNPAPQVELNINVTDGLPVATGIPTLSPVGLGAMLLLMLGLGGLLIRRNPNL